jgi:hypothetical protein
LQKKSEKYLPAVPKIQTKLSSTLASLFSIIPNCNFFNLLPKVKDKKMISIRHLDAESALVVGQQPHLGHS